MDQVTPLYLVLNLGFRSLRACVFTQEGEVLFRASRSVETIQLSEGVEQSPIELISKLETLLEAVAEHPSIVKRIQFMTFTGSSTCLIATDINYHAIGNCLLVADRRAAPEAVEISEMKEFKSLSIKGRHDLDGTQMLPKILWKKRHTDLPKSGVRYLSLNDFFCAFFTGRAFTDNFNAAKLYFDVTERTYPKALYQKLGIQLDELPEVVQPGTVAGELLEKFATRFHLPKSCRYVVSSYDAICGFWGSHPKPFEACDVSGTVTSLRALVTPNSETQFSSKLFYQEINSQIGILGGSNNLGGGLVEWAKDLFFREEEDPYLAIESQARDSLPGARGLLFLPYLLGERAPLWNADARGVFLGIERFHHRGDFARAILESAGFALLDLLNEIEFSGFPIHRIRTSGGLSRLSFAAELKADITGREIVRLDDFESTSVGAFILMAAGVGSFASPMDAAEKLVQPKEIISPNMKNHEAYRQAHMLYKDAYHTLIPFFEKRQQVCKLLYGDTIFEALNL